MKPLVRWVVGSPEQAGIDCLLYSIELWQKIFGDHFDMAVCYNYLMWERYLTLLKSLKIKLINQYDYVNSHAIPPEGPAWKLYPARLRKDSHEIIIDNDLILYKPLQKIYDFLASDKFLALEGISSNYGNLNHLVPKSAPPINTGIVGLPPGADLHQKITKKLKLAKLDEWSFYDEQGLLASILTREDYILINREEVAICNPNYTPVRGDCGIHFTGINQNRLKHWNFWDRDKLNFKLQVF